MGTIKCCKECHEKGNNYIGCHSKCEQYKKEYEMNEETKQKRFKDMAVHNAIRSLDIHRTRTKQHKPK